MVSLPVDMHDLIRSAIGLLEHSIDRRISIVTNLNAKSAMVMGDPALLETAVLNLGLNARDAISTGGVITIETSSATLEQDFITQNSADIDPGDYVEISVADTGVGMSEEVKEHLYEPFYTTKGKGTGLGLAAVYGTVKEHNGAILVTSKLKHGTHFRLYLPLCKMSASEIQADNIRTVHGSGCILLVDDELIIRETASEMLRTIGYEVLLAEDGAEALEIYRREGHRIQLVILDVVMPSLNGPDTFFALRSMNPEIKVILSSGYGFDTGAKELVSQGLFGFIQKPFRRNELHKVIQDSLSDIRVFDQAV